MYIPIRSDNAMTEQGRHVWWLIARDQNGPEPLFDVHVCTLRGIDICGWLEN